MLPEKTRDLLLCSPQRQTVSARCIHPGYMMFRDSLGLTAAQLHSCGYTLTL